MRVSSRFTCYRGIVAHLLAVWCCKATLILVGIVLFGLTSGTARGQGYLTSTGQPSFAAPEPVDLGFTDTANGNLHLDITLASLPQRANGQPLPIHFTYDSSIWNIAGAGLSEYWNAYTPGVNGSVFMDGWRLPLEGLGIAGTGQGPINTSGCRQDFEWVDNQGTARFFPLTVGTTGSGCPTSATAYATDSSGYLMSVVYPTPTVQVYAPDGSLVDQNYPAKDTLGRYILAWDSNGNYLSSDTELLEFLIGPVTGTYFDSLGRPALQSLSPTSCPGTGNWWCYQVPTAQGTNQISLVGAYIPVKTNFGQSGVTECNSNCLLTVIQSITITNPASPSTPVTYVFKYDCDSSTGNPACGSPANQSGYYGLLTSVTLPTGGTVTYGYQTFKDAYGNYSRWLNSRTSEGGTWSYTPKVLTTTCGSGPGCTQSTTVVAPSGATKVTTFTLNNGAWPTQVTTSSGGTLLTVTNTYDFSNNCPLLSCSSGAAYVRLSKQQASVPVPSGLNVASQTSYTYDSPSTGNIITKQEWGYYPGSFPSTADRTTQTTYLSTGTNDIDRPTSVTVSNATATVAKTLYTYDSYSGSCPGLGSVPGVSNHDDTNFGLSYTTRGNLTQIQKWTGSTYLTTAQNCYDMTGQITKKFDSAGNATSYGYTDNFFSDNGANPPQTYSPSKPTNAYVTSITQPIIGTTYAGYYYGSGMQALATDPNGVTSYSHFMDPFGLDRSTEDDYSLVSGTPIEWDKTVYTSMTETDAYLAVGDTTPSSNCQSCQHKQILLDSWGRKISDKIQNYPGGVSTVDTVYDGDGRVWEVSHPYQSSGEVYETYYYDGLNRMLENSHPDSQYVTTAYGTGVSARGVGSQQGSPSTYGYGYPVLHTDEAGKTRQEWKDGFGRVIEIDDSITPGAYAQGTFSVGGTANPPFHYTETVTIYVGSAMQQVSFSTGISLQGVCAAIANAVTQTGIATGSCSGTRVTVSADSTGTAGDYPLSASVGGSPAAPVTVSASGMSGGVNATSTATLYTYNVLDQLTSVVQGVQTRSSVYDSFGRPTSITTPEAGTQTLVYTSAGTQCSGDPDNFCQRTDARGVVTNYYYDTSNRLTGKSYTIPGGSNVAAMPNVCTTSTGQSANTCYNYDQGGAGAYALGRLTQTIDPSGSETNAYDPAGRITQVAKVIGTNTYTMGYQYNAGDELTQITYPSDRIVKLSYNLVGQPCEIAPDTTSCGSSSSPYATSYGYNAAGQLTGLKYGNGVYGSFGFSQNRSQLNCMDYSTTNRTVCAHDLTTSFGLNYFYALDPTNCTAGTAGNNGQIECIADATSTTITPGAAGRTVAYTYDALGRLATALTTGSSQFPKWGLSETYDRYGNRLSQSVTAGTGPMSSLSFGNPGGAQTNRPDGWCFDASGNLLSKTASPCPPTNPSFVYDGENRMVSAPGAGGAYVYDGNGTRVQKCLPNCSSPTSSTVFLFSGSQDIAEYDNGAAPGSPSREFIYSGSIPGSGLLATITGGSTPKTTYFHADHLDWRVSTDGTPGSPTYGQLNGQQEHYPFGESWYSQNQNEFVFTSYQRDSETSLDYAMARYYDSSAGRFCSADPLGGDPDDSQSWNRYAYVRNDPINMTDPSGQGWLAALMDALMIFTDFLTLGATTPETIQMGIDLQGIQAMTAIGAMTQASEQTQKEGQGQVAVPPPLSLTQRQPKQPQPTWKNCVSYNDALITHSKQYKHLNNDKWAEKHPTSIGGGPVSSDSAAVSPKQFGMSKNQMARLRGQGKGITGTVYNDDGSSIDFSVDDRIADAKNPQNALGKIRQANQNNQTVIELEGVPYKDEKGKNLPDLRRTIDLQGYMVHCPPGTR